MIGIFTLALGADEAREVALTGEYFEIRNALFPILLIELLDRSGGVICRMDNPEQSDFVRPGKYDTVRITNGPTAQVIKHFYGTGDAGSRRTSGLVRIDGTSAVSVVDGEKSRTLMGGMFSGSPNCIPGAAANAIVQLWNPAASGKNLIVGSLEIVAPAAGALTGLVYTVAAQSPTDQTSGRAANNLSGAAIGVGQVRVDAASVIPGVFANNLLRTMSAAASQAAGWKVRGAVVVPPGKGLTIAATAVNLQLIANFEWFEEAV